MSTLQVVIVVLLIVLVIAFIGWAISLYLSITRQMTKIDNSWDMVSDEMANRFEVLVGLESFVTKVDPDTELLNLILRAKNAFARSRQKRSVKSGSNGEVLFHDKLLPELLKWVERNENKISQKSIRVIAAGLSRSIKRANTVEQNFNEDVLDFRLKTERFPNSWISRKVIEAPQYQTFHIDEKRADKKFSITYKDEKYAY